MKRLMIPLLISLLALAGGIVSAEMGGNAKLAWNPNTESDLAGYRIYYAQSPVDWEDPGAFVQGKDVGNVTEFKIIDLPNIQEKVVYEFSVTAYDFVGNESDYSAEHPKESFDFTSPVPPNGCTLVNE